MNSSSNTTSYSTLTGSYTSTQLPSGMAINTDTLVFTGAANASVLLDLLMRNLGSGTVKFDVIVCATGQNTANVASNVVQVSLPANAGNNGTAFVGSLANLAPQLFDLDLAGNTGMLFESTLSIYLRNKAALTADVWVTAKARNF